MIESKDNQYIKTIRRLQRKKGREETGLFIAEGRRLVEDLFSAGLRLELLLYSADFCDKNLDIWREAAREVFAVSPSVLAKVHETAHGQGVIAVYQQKQWDLGQLQEEDAFVFILSGIQDPGNLGTIVRNSAAAGVSGLFLCDGAVELYNPKVVRSSMGSIARLPVFYDDNAAVYAWLQATGFSLYLADRDGAVPYWDLPAAGRVAVILGNEGAGPAIFWRQKAEQAVAIPLEHDVESLNVAMAQGILAFDRQRRRKAFLKKIIAKGNALLP